MNHRIVVQPSETKLCIMMVSVCFHTTSLPSMKVRLGVISMARLLARSVKVVFPAFVSGARCGLNSFKTSEI